MESITENVEATYVEERMIVEVLNPRLQLSNPKGKLATKV
jgi:hypothetical protein